MKYKIVKLKYSQIRYEHGRELKLRDQSGIYSWYRGINIKDCVSNKELFLKKIDKLLSNNLSDTFNSKIGNIYNVSLFESGGCLSASKQSNLEKITETKEGRESLSNIIECTNELQSPLYIGKAKNIKQRITDHVNGNSDLLSRLLEAKIDIDECFIKIVYFDDEILEHLASYLNDDVDKTVTLIEELATRMSPSAFVRRIG